MDDLNIARAGLTDNLKSFHFWRSHTGFVGCLIIGCCIILLLKDLSYPFKDIEYTSTQQFIFNHASIIIHAFYLAASLVALNALADIFIENATARHIQLKAEDISSKINNLAGEQYRLEDIEAICLPDQPRRTARISLLFSEMIKDANNRDFESVNNLIEPLMEKQDIPIFRLTMLQKYAITIGILGTFIGIFLAISSLGGDLKNMVTAKNSAETLMNDAAALSSGLFSKLSIAFSTSISGLQVSLLIGLLVFYVSKKLDKTYLTMEKCLSTCNTLLRNSKLVRDDKFVDSVHKLTGVIRDFEEKADSHAQLVSARIEGVNEIIERQNIATEKRIIALTEKIEAGLNRLKVVGDNVNDFSTNLEHSHQQFFDNLNNTLGSYESHSMGIINAVQQQCSTILSQMAEQQGQFDSDIQSLRKSQNQQSAEQLEQVQFTYTRFFNGIQEGQTAFLNEIQKIYDIVAMKELGDKMDNTVQKVSMQFDETINKLTINVDETISTLKSLVTETQQQSNQHISTSVSKLQNSLESLGGNVEITEQQRNQNLVEMQNIQLSRLEEFTNAYKEIEGQHLQQFKGLAAEVIATIDSNSKETLEKQKHSVSEFTALLPKLTELVTNIAERLDTIKASNAQISADTLDKQTQLFENVNNRISQSEEKQADRYQQYLEQQNITFDRVADSIDSITLNSEKLAEVLDEKLSKPASSIESEVNKNIAWQQQKDTQLAATMQNLVVRLDELQQFLVAKEKSTLMAKTKVFLTTPITYSLLTGWMRRSNVEKK